MDPADRKVVRTGLLLVLLIVVAYAVGNQFIRWHKQERACTTTLTKWGYTSVKLGNEIENLCGDGTYSVAFTARDKQNRRVKGGICCIVE